MTSEREELAKRITALTTVQEIAQDLTSELDPRRLLNKILHSAIHVLDASAGSLLIWVPPNELEFAVSAEPRLIGCRMPADRGFAGWAFTREEPLIISDVCKDDRHFQELVPDFRTQSLLAVPLMTPTERIGVVELLNKKSGERFDEQDRDILTALSAQAAAAIVNARLYQELREERNRFIALEDQMHRKLARDLHDGPAQTLAAMMMDVEFILRLCEREPQSVPGELDKLRQAAARTLAQVRTTMFELRPVILETQGLQAALESYVERLASTEQMDVRLEIRNLAARLPPGVERLCFAIIQEAVGNVKKHAHATVARIIVERRPGDLVIAVRDDGTGFDVARAQQEYDRRGNLGLLNMQERAEMLGARYAIHSARGRGTLVSLVVPLEGRRAPVAGAGAAHAEPADELGADRSLHEVDRPARSNGAPVGPARRRKGTGPLGLLSQGESAGDGA